MPNKGSLSQAASEMLREAGYKQRSDSKQLSITDTANGVEFFYLRPRDIAVYVGEGTLDLGVTGRDLLLDSGAKAEEILELGFGRSTFRFAGPAGVLSVPLTWPASGSPRRTPASSRSTSTSAGSRRP